MPFSDLDKFHVWKARFKFRILRFYRVLLDHGGEGQQSHGCGRHNPRSNTHIMKGHKGPHTNRCRHCGPQGADHTWVWTPKSTGPGSNHTTTFGHLEPLWGFPRQWNPPLGGRPGEKVYKGPRSRHEAVSVGNSEVLVPEVWSRRRSPDMSPGPFRTAYTVECRALQGMGPRTRV